MLYETLNQPIIFLIFVLAGFVSGFVYDFEKFLNYLFNKNKVFIFIFDFLTTIFVFFIFYYCVFEFCYGEIRLYQFITFFISFIIQKIIFGKILAKMLYSFYSNIKVKLKTKKRKVK